MQMSRSPSHHISSLRSGRSLNSCPIPTTPPTVNITPIIRPSSHNVAPNPYSPSTHPSHHPVSQPASPDHRNNHGGLASHTQSHYVSPTPTSPNPPDLAHPGNHSRSVDRANAKDASHVGGSGTLLHVSPAQDARHCGAVLILMRWNWYCRTGPSRSRRVHPVCMYMVPTATWILPVNFPPALVRGWVSGGGRGGVSGQGRHWHLTCSPPAWSGLIWV